MSSSIYHTQKISLNLKKLVKLLVIQTTILGGFFYIQSVVASCTIISGSPDFFISGHIFPPLDPRTPINGTLAKRITYAYSTAGGLKTYCTSTGSTATLTSDFTHISGELYDTALPGISMRIKIGDSANYAYLPGVISNTGQWEIYAVPVEIELIKTSNSITAGNIPSRTLARAHLTAENNFNVFNVTMTAPLTVAILQPTCSAKIPNSTVTLGDVSVLDFNTQGRTKLKDFTIDLDCTGVAGTTNVYVTLTDANNPGNTTRQLKLAPDSSAQGIALEMTNRYGLVNFGPDLAGIGNPGQWFDGTTGIGSYSIPLSVNYIRLPGPIKAGTANAGVTYTLNYD